MFTIMTTVIIYRLDSETSWPTLRISALSPPTRPSRLVSKPRMGGLFSQLKKVAASQWECAHLLACRVVRREAQRNLLPILSQHAVESALQSLPDEIRGFLQGPDPAFTTQSEHFLVRGSSYGISLAQVWAALATFKGSHDRTQQQPPLQDPNESEEDDHVEERLPKRLRRETSLPDFTDSTRIQIGSSSPLNDGSDGWGGSQTSSLGYVDPDAHQLRIYPGDNTVRLASCVIRHILYFAPPQHSALNSVVVEFRDAKTRLAPITLTRKRQIVAIDDGGLCLRQQTSAGGEFVLAKSHAAILEAKTQFQCLENGKQIVSDTCFGQMVCEALAARLSNAIGNSER
ncbi:hypothetical protein BJY00DRAFT_289062 [Aspergillus carlsbadensis]|nr:hypothetical protein BJY00DRAFT_289062 [Aspergillus carlsbadensis]